MPIHRAVFQSMTQAIAHATMIFGALVGGGLGEEAARTCCAAGISLLRVMRVRRTASPSSVACLGNPVALLMPGIGV